MESFFEAVGDLDEKADRKMDKALNKVDKSKEYKQKSKSAEKKLRALSKKYGEDEDDMLGALLLLSNMAEEAEGY